MLRFLYESVLKTKKKAGPWKLLYKINKLIVNLFYPLSQLGNHEYGLDEKSDIIVSLTSFPARIHTVWVTIASLLNQSCRPKAVILWLAEEQFEERKLPGNLLKLCKRGLEIRYCEDLKPHKKYYEAMRLYPECCIVTADDDIFYPENFLQNLEDAHRKYPGTILCSWSHVISFDESGGQRAYNEWSDEPLEQPAYGLLPVGCNGVLYPPRCMDEEIFDKEKIKNYVLYTDDLWLKCMSVKAGTKAMNYQKIPLIYFNNLFSQTKGLWKMNTVGEKNPNDSVWRDLMKFYPEVEERVKKSRQ